MMGVGAGGRLVSEATQTVISRGVWAVWRGACFLADSHHFLSCHLTVGRGGVPNPR